jgi:rhomboid family GlyGly-CTERM serine protease
VERAEDSRIVKRIPLITISVCLAAIMLSSTNPLFELFALDRSALFHGEVWRLITGHLTHYTGAHLAYNLFVFALFGWIAEKAGRLRYELLLLWLSLFVSLFLIVGKPDLVVYGGLSGVVCGLVIAVSLMGVAKPGPWRLPAVLLLILLPLKVIVEFVMGSSILPYAEPQPFTMVPLSHAAGIIGGALFFFLDWLTQKTKRSTLREVSR